MSELAKRACSNIAFGFLNKFGFDNHYGVGLAVNSLTLSDISILVVRNKIPDARHHSTLIHNPCQIFKLGSPCHSSHSNEDVLYNYSAEIQQEIFSISDPAALFSFLFLFNVCVIH